MNFRVALLCTLALSAASLSAQVKTPQVKTANTLDIYFIDVEGGHSTLYVSPGGEAMLIDTGSPGTRDVERIMDVITAAGVKQIDQMLLTHYHGDHVGGLEALAKRIPIQHYIDHGTSVEEREQVSGFRRMYEELYAKATRMVAKPGDNIPFAGTSVVVVTSAGKALRTPISGAPGAGRPNAACKGFVPRDESRVDPDNPQSVGIVMAYGKFRTINLGDFTWNVEPDLMCPNNPVGTVDLYLTSHHGIDQSGSAALVHGLQPRVAVMHNSTRKGGAVQTMQVLHSSPGLEDVWQLHWAYAAGLEHNSPGVFIANTEDAATVAGVLTAPAPTFGQGRGPAPAGAPGAAAPTGPGAAAPAAPGPDGRGGGGRGAGGPGGGRGGHTGTAFWIKVSASPDGSFTVTNTRNGFTKTYAARK